MLTASLACPFTSRYSGAKHGEFDNAQQRRVAG
eukprot:SAG11_NODE_25892_length_352_cov_1.426877_2_plen_32_part_01